MVDPRAKPGLALAALNITSGALVRVQEQPVVTVGDIFVAGAVVFCAALLLSLPVALLIAQANQLVFASMEERVFARSAEQLGFTVRRDQSGDLLVDIPSMGVPAMGAAANPQDKATVPAASLQGTYWEQIVEVAYGRYFMMLAWCALYLALLTGEKARAAERRVGAVRARGRRGQGGGGARPTSGCRR